MAGAIKSDESVDECKAAFESTAMCGGGGVDVASALPLSITVGYSWFAAAMGSSTVKVVPAS